MTRALRFLAVQLGPATYLGRFAFLLAYDWFLEHDTSSFVTYTVALALIRPFVAAVSLRARLALMSDALGLHDYPALQQVLVLASGIGLAAAALASIGTSFFIASVLLAAVRVTENLLEAQLSAFQRQGRRDLAIAIQAIRNFAAMTAYALIFVFGSLIVVLWIELAVGLVATGAFWRTFTLVPQQGRYRQVVAVSAKLGTLSFLGGLAGLVITRSLLRVELESEAGQVATILSAFAISARFTTGSGLFYRRTVDDVIDRFSRSVPTFIVLGAGAVLAFSVSVLDRPYTVWLIGGCAVITNSLALLGRQTLMLRGEVKKLASVHIIEVGLLLLSFLLGAHGYYLTLIVGWQALRLLSLCLLVGASQHD